MQNVHLLSQIPSLQVNHIHSADELTLSDEKDTVIIDAIFGTGINKPTDGLIADVISKINKSGLPVTAIDVPSGLPVDEPMPAKWAVIKASVTLTFHLTR